jgi:hypothetical protein
VTNGSQYAGGFGSALYATIYQAQNNEVIWTAANSAITNVFSGPASLAATTATRVTVNPITDTFAYSVIDTSETITFSALAQSFAQEITAVTTEQTSFVATGITAGLWRLPHETTTVNRPTIKTVPTTLSQTVFAESAMTVAWQALTVTQLGEYITKTPITRLGIAFEDSFRLSTTRTRLDQNQGYATSQSYVITLPGSVVTTGFGTDTGTITSWGFSESTSARSGKTSYLPRALGATTTMPTFAYPYEGRTIEGLVGFRTPNDSVAAFYDLAGINEALVFANLFPLASRGVTTVMPINNFDYYTSSGDEENYDIGNAGILSLSGLSGTGTSTATVGSETSKETFTFEFTPQGQGFRTTIAQRTSVGSVANLGKFETAYYGFLGGIYLQDGSTTVSKTRGFSSLASGSAAQYYEPISFFTVTNFSERTALVWTASRNSMAVPA